MESSMEDTLASIRRIMSEDAERRCMALALGHRLRRAQLRSGDSSSALVREDHLGPVAAEAEAEKLAAEWKPGDCGAEAGA